SRKAAVPAARGSQGKASDGPCMSWAEVTRAARSRDIVYHCDGHHLNLEVKIMVGMKTQADFDPAKAEAFEDRFLMALNNGALCLMVSVGHRTGLFDVLRTLPPATSHEIATRAGLHERYVREWLGAMVTAGVVEVDQVTQLFALPVEHAAWVTRAAAADNLAGFAPYIAVLVGVVDSIVECFPTAAGLP